ncbi:MAG: hypothetical protein RLZZ210_803 [Pseudomonadota bacterium]|jgi:uncharacterized protein (UPF0335 family)
MPKLLPTQNKPNQNLYNTQELDLDEMFAGIDLEENDVGNQPMSAPPTLDRPYQPTYQAQDSNATHGVIPIGIEQNTPSFKPTSYDKQQKIIGGLLEKKQGYEGLLLAQDESISKREGKVSELQTKNQTTQRFLSNVKSGIDALKGTDPELHGKVFKMLIAKTINLNGISGLNLPQPPVQLNTEFNQPQFGESASYFNPTNTVNEATLRQEVDRLKGLSQEKIQITSSLDAEIKSLTSHRNELKAIHNALTAIAKSKSASIDNKTKIAILQIIVNAQNAS